VQTIPPVAARTAGVWLLAAHRTTLKQPNTNRSMQFSAFTQHVRLNHHNTGAGG
jgi:hypothetical protein